MRTGALSTSELNYLVALHKTVDEQRRTHVMSLDKYAKVHYEYLKLLKRFRDHGAKDKGV